MVMFEIGRESWILIVGVVLLFFMAIPYLLGPFLVMFSTRFQLDPEIEPFDPEGVKFPMIAREHFVRSQWQLQELGFVPVEWMLLPATIPHLTTIAALFHKPSQSELAMATVIFADSPQVTIQTVTFVEFNLDFSSGTNVVVSNANALSSFATPEHVVKYQFPGNQDLKSLYEIFQRVAARSGSPRLRVDPLVTRHRGNAIDLIREDMLRELNREVDRGWMFVNHLTNQFCFRVPGAFRATWMELPPFKQIRLIANRRRNRELLTELGLS